MKKVLAVDDEPDIVNGVKKSLESLGVEVRTAESAEEADKILKKEKFDLIILDVLMPGKSGWELGAEIKYQWPSQKIMFLTVVTLSEQGKKIMQKVKPEAYITKPFKVAEFRKTVQKALQ